MKRGGEEYEEILEQIERAKEEGDWEAGSFETFLATLLHETSDIPTVVPEDFTHSLLEKVEDICGREGGMLHSFRDLAFQYWASLILKATIQHTVEFRPPSYKNRQSLVGQIDSLVLALDENIESTVQRRNEPPAFDLFLTENDSFLTEIRRLNLSLRELREALISLKAEVNNKKSLASKALEEFVLKLSGELGNGFAKTVTWGTRMALAWFAIGILKDIGFPVEGLVKTVQEKVLPI